MTRRHVYAIAVLIVALFSLSHVYVSDRPYQQARTFWSATGQYIPGRVQGPERIQEPEGQNWPHNLQYAPTQDQAEEDEEQFISTIPDADDTESLPTEESEESRAPTFHIIQPPSKIRAAIAECREQCKSPRSRDIRLHRRQVSDRVLDRAYGEVISFPFTGEFPYVLRNTSQFALQRIFDARLALLPSSSHTTLEEADYVYFNLDGEGLRSCEKCSSSLGIHGFDQRVLVQQWISSTTDRLKGRRDYPSLLLVLPRIWHAYTANMLDSRVRKGFEEDGVVLNIEVSDHEGRGEFWQVPYPTMFHLDGSIGEREVKEWILTRERKILLTCSLGRLDVLNPSSSIMRKAISTQLSSLALDRNDLYFTYHFDPSTAYVAMSESVFCLQPPGDSATRRGFFDSILLGCIPVIFSSSTTTYLPFASLNLEEHAIILSPDQAYTGILEALQAVSLEEVRRRQEGLAGLASRLNWGLPGAEGDVFQSLLGMLRELRDQ